MKKSLGLYFLQIIFLFFILNFLTLHFVAPHIPFLGFFPYRDFALSFNLPLILTNLSNFDGVHYLNIANFGYAQYEHAFFPLYPFAIKLLSPVFFQNSLAASLAISNLSLLLSLVIFYRYLQLLKIKQTFSIILFFILFPTSFYLSAVYTESIFFLIFISTLYLFESKRFGWAAFLAILASLTRINGIFLTIYFLLYFYYHRPIKKYQYLYIFAPLFGLALYSIYLFLTTNDPLAFIHSISNFGRQTSPVIFLKVIYRYLKIFILASHDFKYYIAILEFSVFTLFFSVLSLQLFKYCQAKTYLTNISLVSLNLISFATLLLPTLTGTFSSLPRYSLMSISVFIFLGQLKNIYLKALILLIFIILHVLTLAFFSRGYFIS